jgi:hypothetical protein
MAAAITMPVEMLVSTPNALVAAPQTHLMQHAVNIDVLGHCPMYEQLIRV